MTVEHDLVLAQRQSFARGDAQLPFDEVEAGDAFGHRMLDLQPRIHLDEIEGAVRRDDEFHRSGADIANRFRRRDGSLAHGAPPRLAQAGSGRLLENFLMASLRRTIALEQ